MELLFVALGGAILGLAVRYLLPGRTRTTQGVVLVPAVGTAVAAVAWVALTWLGWKWDGGWIWWVSLILAGVAAFATDLVLSRRRIRADQLMLHTLNRPASARPGSQGKTGSRPRTGSTAVGAPSTKTGSTRGA